MMQQFLPLKPLSAFSCNAYFIGAKARLWLKSIYAILINQPWPNKGCSKKLLAHWLRQTP
jgi:hypothetical protein